MQCIIRRKRDGSCMLEGDDEELEERHTMNVGAPHFERTFERHIAHLIDK